MKVEMDKAVLERGLATALAVRPAKTAVNAARSAKFEAGASGCKLSGTDGDIELSVAVPGDVQEPGEVLLGDSVHHICREGVGDKILLESTGNGLTVSCGTGNWSLQTEDVKEFPQYTSKGSAEYVQVESVHLAKAIRMTEFATDPSSMRYALGGVHLEFNEGRIEAAATDSRRLSVVSIACTGSSKGSVVAPLKSVKLLERLLAEGEVRVGIFPNNLEVQGEGWTLRTRLVEGRFPNYRALMQNPKKVAKLSVVAEPLARAVRSAAICTTQASAGIDFEIQPNGDLQLSSSAADVGKAELSVPCQSDGAGKWSLDHKYVSDFLKRLPALTQVEIICEEDKWHMRAEGSLYLVMGMSKD